MSRHDKAQRVIPPGQPGPLGGVIEMHEGKLHGRVRVNGVTYRLLAEPCGPALWSVRLEPQPH